MRRKSERTSTKKAKSSPEKKEKVDKTKRTRTKRRKQSSSDNESPDEVVPAQASEVSKVDSEPPTKILAKEDSPEESQDQVWQVKASESSGDVGEIQKLKICLTRPPSTPERVDRSPRSKRKHSRATSSSDTPSLDGDEKKKSKHRFKRSNTDSKDESEKNQDSQGEEVDTESQPTSVSNSESTDIIKTDAETVSTDDTPMSTTNEEPKGEIVDTTDSSTHKEAQEAKNDNSVDTSNQDKSDETHAEDKASDADTTVISPKPESSEQREEQPTSDQVSPIKERSLSTEKSEVLELHAEESRCESSDAGVSESQDAAKSNSEAENDTTNEVSIKDKKSEISEKSESNVDTKTDTNKTDVVESSQSSEADKTQGSVSKSNKESEKSVEQSKCDNKAEVSQSTNELHNGQTTVVSRKRRWGSRPSKLSTQKSITISTDVLKEIIPDVKPVEFDEVVEEKKHRRVEVPERFDRPVLPKIVIDNTESIEVKKENPDNKDKENIKIKEKHISSSRKISIVKDSDSIITRPPSPPRHKQSSILYITNLVRPFTLTQLTNLLQRTGRIVENGFWIDRIKSKCYVKYETEDQAVETRHALHGVTWPVSNPKSLHVDFSTQDDFDNAKVNEENDNAQKSTIPGTVEDWLREQDIKRERGEIDKPWERKIVTREWDVGKNEKDKEVSRPDKMHREDRLDKRRHRSLERSPEPARKFKKKEEEAPAKLLDDLFRKTKTTPCIYWLPLSAETIAVKEEQRRQHMAEHERRLQELRRPHRRH